MGWTSTVGLSDPRDTLTPRLTTCLDLGFLPLSPAGGGLSGSGRGAVLKSVVFWRPFGVSRRLLEDGHPRSGREFRDQRGSCVIARGVAEFSSDGLRAEGAWDRPLLGLGLARGGSGSLLPRRLQPCSHSSSHLPVRLQLCWPRAGGTLVPPNAAHGLGPPCPSSKKPGLWRWVGKERGFQTFLILWLLALGTTLWTSAA